MIGLRRSGPMNYMLPFLLLLPLIGLPLTGMLTRASPVLLASIPGGIYAGAATVGTRVGSKAVNKGMGVADRMANKALDKTAKSLLKASDRAAKTILKTNSYKGSPLKRISPFCRKPVAKYVGCMTVCISNMAGESSITAGLVKAVGFPVCFIGRCTNPALLPCMPEIASLGVDEMKDMVKMALNVGVKAGVTGIGVAKHGKSIAKSGVTAAMAIAKIIIHISKYIAVAVF